MEEFSREELTHKLKEAEDRAAYYRRIIEYAPDGIYITDGDANAVLINPAFERISGLERDKLIGKNHRELEKKRIIPSLSAASMACGGKDPAEKHVTPICSLLSLLRRKICRRMDFPV